MSAFPWHAAMRFGFGVLKLHPEQFWAMTPRELASAMDARSNRGGGVAPSRTKLDALISAFPDQKEPAHGR